MFHTKFCIFEDYMAFFPQERIIIMRFPKETDAQKSFRITDLLCETLIMLPLIKYFSSYFFL